jgi:shikimate dehydrogenase
MKKFGLIGHPVAHSLSPALFKAAYDGKYIYDLIEGDDFENSYRRFIDEYDAINVTAPFKELAFKKAEGFSNECKAVGAANILKKYSNPLSVYADNSDIAGVAGALRSAGLEENCSKKALVAGCGGAAMAAVYAIWSEFNCSTVVVNRSLEKAEKFVERMKLTSPLKTQLAAAPIDEFETHFKESDIIIYTLPVAIPALEQICTGMVKEESEYAVSGKIILEANYKDPAFTPKMLGKLCRVTPGIVYVSGKEWLLQQAVEAYRSFTGEEPNIEAMRKVL